MTSRGAPPEVAATPSTPAPLPPHLRLSAHIGAGRVDALLAGMADALDSHADVIACGVVAQAHGQVAGVFVTLSTDAGNETAEVAA